MKNQILFCIIISTCLVLPGCTFENTSPMHRTIADGDITIEGNSSHWWPMGLSGFENAEWDTRLANGTGSWNVLWMLQSECSNWVVGDPYIKMEGLSMDGITQGDSMSSEDGMLDPDEEYCLAIENNGSEDIHLTVHAEGSWIP